MGSTTTHGFPYPVGTDRVMDGDNAIQALAQYTDDYVTTQRGASKVKFVTNTQTSSGGGHLTIPHGLGVIPTGAVVTLYGVTGTPRVGTITALDINNVTVQVYNPATGAYVANTSIQSFCVAWAP